MNSATYTAEEVAALVGVSSWAIYAQAREGTLPDGLEPIRVGRRLVWPRARVNALLGVEASGEA